MLQIFLLTAFCYEAYAQLVTYKECLDKDGKYAEEAFACDDVESEKVCKKFFPEENKIGVGEIHDRQKPCWQDASTDTDADEEIVKFATKSCPKTCGLCCKTAAFDCEDDPSFDCPDVRKKDQCKEPWKSQLNLVEKCPKTCGLCGEKNGDCQDKEPNCDKNQCKNVDFLPAMKVNCKNTCGFCDEETTTPADTAAPEDTTAPADADQTTAAAATTEAATVPCVDDPRQAIKTSQEDQGRCDTWRQNGFCINILYPEEYIKKYCGKMCGKC